VKRLLLFLLACTPPAEPTLSTEAPMKATPLLFAAAVLPATWTATGGTVSPDGLYTAGHVAGAHAVTFAHNGFVDTATATVVCNLPPTITITPVGDTLDVAGTTALTAVVETSCAVTDPSLVVTWFSGDEDVATVASTGDQTATVTAVASGLTYVYGTWNTARDSVLICVNGYAIENTPSDMLLEIAATGGITASVTSCGDSSSTALGWRTRNAAVATVVGSGQSATVTGVGAGTVYIVDSIVGSNTVKDSTLVSVATAVGCDSVKTGLQLMLQFDGPSPYRYVHRNEADVAVHSHSQSTTTFNECAAAVKFDLRVTDPMEGTAHRVEFKLHPDSGNGTVALPSGTSVAGYYGSEVWGGWSLYIPSDWTTAAQSETVIQAWSACSNGRSPPWEIQTSGTLFKVYTRYQNGTTNVNTMAGSAQITKGAWHHFVWHHIWKDDATGLLEVWMNGTKFVNRPANATIWRDCHQVTRLKFGMYKWSNWGDVTQRVIYFDNLRFTNGTGNYNLVVPR
jgi:hypothetical protein